MSASTFRSTIRYWRAEQASGLAVADIPSELIAALGGLRQQRVRGMINAAEYISNVMQAGGGRLALSVSQKMMRAAGVSPRDATDFENRADVRRDCSQLSRRGGSERPPSKTTRTIMIFPPSMTPLGDRGGRGDARVAC